MMPVWPERYLQLLILQEPDDQCSHVLNSLLIAQYGEQIIEHHYLEVC